MVVLRAVWGDVGALQTSVTEQLCGAYCRCLCGLDDQSSVSVSVVRVGAGGRASLLVAYILCVGATCAWLGVACQQFFLSSVAHALGPFVLVYDA